MKFSTEFLDEIRARVPLSEVVGARVQLKKAGREWRGLSPFNKERTPSFFVNDQKQFYHDFSSGKSGDIFTFLVDVEGLGFPEAVERLAGMAGLPMPRPFHSKWIAQRGRRARSLQGEYSRAMLWHKARSRSHPTVCERGRTMQGCDRLCRGASAASILPHRFFDRTRKNLSTKWTDWSPSGSAPESEVSHAQFRRDYHRHRAVRTRVSAAIGGSRLEGRDH